MRIGFDAKRYYLNSTGLGNYSRDLIRMLETYFPEHEYYKYTPKIPQQLRHNSNLINVKLPNTRLHKMFPSLWRNSGIVRDLRRDNIELFHGLSGEIPSGILQSGIKSCVTVHDLIFLRYPEWYKPIDRILYDRKFRYAANNADKVIAISQQTKNDIMGYYGVSADKIAVIYQGCHPAFKQKRSTLEKEALRQKYNLPSQFILNVGSIEPRKNALQLVKAVENLDIPLVLIGKETPYAATIKAYIQSKGLSHRIFILQGFTMDELATIYSMAEIFVYPSLFEGFGIPIIEALYSGTPVITNRSGVFPEAGGPFSYYVDPQNTEEMAYAIESVLDNTSMREQMVQKGLEYVSRFDDATIASQMMDFYLSMK